MEKKRRKVNDGIRIRRRKKTEDHKVEEKRFKKREEERMLSLEKEAQREYFRSEYGQERMNVKKTSHKKHSSLRKVGKGSIRFLRRNKKWITLFLVYILSLFFLLSFFGRTKVIYHPKKEKISIEKKLLITDSSNSPIRLGHIHIGDSVQVVYTAKKVKEEQGFAQGTVTVFNDYSTEPQRLLPHTRFKSASGKIFFSGNREIIIPGKTKDGAGKIDILLTAKEKGSSYNIDLTDFTLPGFEEAGLVEKYGKIYAISKTKFSGGEKKMIPVIDDEDKKEILKKAQEQLKEKLEHKLLSQKTDQLRIIQKGVQLTYRKPIWERISDRELKLTLSADIDALALRKDELLSFVKKYSIEKKGERDDFIFLNEELPHIVVTYVGSQKENFAKIKKAKILIEGYCIIVWVVDEDSLKKDLESLPYEKIPQLIKGRKNIASLFIEISPFWMDSIHGDVDKIHIKKEKELLVEEKKETN